MEVSSNSVRSGDSRAGTPTFRSVRANEVTASLQLILAVDGVPADAGQAADFMMILGGRGVSFGDIRVLEDDGRLLWAALPIVSPGRTALLFVAPMSLVPNARPAVLDSIERLCGSLAGQGVHLAQLLIDPTDTATAAVFVDASFRRMAELIYLSRTVRRPIAPPPLPAGFALVPYTDAARSQFAAAVLASYEQSMDCPALNGIRPIEDILDGHQAAGDFDPADWLLLTRDGSPAGVLLLATTPGGDGMEVVYLGLAPAVRGNGHRRLPRRLCRHPRRRARAEPADPGRRLD